MTDCPFCTDGACNKDCQDPQKCAEWVAKEIEKSLREMVFGSDFAIGVAAEPDPIEPNPVIYDEATLQKLMTTMLEESYVSHIKVIDRGYDHKTREIKTTVELHYDKYKPERT